MHPDARKRVTPEELSRTLNALEDWQQKAHWLIGTSQLESCFLQVVYCCSYASVETIGNEFACQSSIPLRTTEGCAAKHEKLDHAQVRATNQQTQQP